MTSAVVSANTAIPRNRMSTPMRYYQNHGYLTGDVLDYGCGRDVHNFARYDPAWHPATHVLERTYETVTCNYVLNVLETILQRTELLDTLRDLISDGGHGLIAIYRARSYDHYTSKGFQCGWDFDTWTALLKTAFSDVRILKTDCSTTYYEVRK